MEEIKLITLAKRTYDLVDHTPVRAGQKQRSPESGTVRETGIIRLNMGGTDLMDELARAEKLDREKYSFRYGLDVERRLVAVYPVPHDTDGSAPVRRHKGKNYIVLDLGNLFKRYPSLIIAREVTCPAMKDVDANGKECMILSLQNAVIRRKRILAPKEAAPKEETKTTSTTPVGQTAAGTQPTPENKS